MNINELESMKTDLKHLKEDHARVLTSHARRAIASVMNDLQDKVRDEERRLSAVLETRIIDGVEIQIPKSMRESNEEKFHVHDGILYLIDREKKFKTGQYDKEGSFHWYSSAWIPNGNKFTRLYVSMIGGDGYGDRAHVSANHYKHPSDDHGYMETRLRLGSFQYRPYIDHILKEVTGWTLKQLRQN